MRQQFPVKHLFGTTYEKYRKVVSGKVESWVSNYLKRLSELNSICESKVQWKINDEIFHEDYNHLFNGIDLQKNDLKQINTLHKNIANDINQEIELLSGKKDNLPNKETIEKIETLSKAISDIFGQIRILNNAIEQESEYQTNKKDSEKIKASPLHWKMLIISTILISYQSLIRFLVESQIFRRMLKSLRKILI